MTDIPDISQIAAIHSPLLMGRGIAHAFFTRAGGVSNGLYASLNGGVGSQDDPDNVSENRRRMAAYLKLSGEVLVPYQIHSNEAFIVEKPFGAEQRPRCDALVTRIRGLCLAVTGADCGMILFADEVAQVIGAAHAGWKGALGGIVEATIAAMESCGASRARVKAVLGPTIGANSYEVGPEFKARFLDADAAFAGFFTPAKRAEHSIFDLPRFIGFRLKQAGIGTFENLDLDTYADPQRFFSFRRATHRKEADYGRLISAIALT